MMLLLVFFCHYYPLLTNSFTSLITAVFTLAHQCDVFPVNTSNNLRILGLMPDLLVMR
jgi:hypothetical protein